MGKLRDIWTAFRDPDLYEAILVKRDLDAKVAAGADIRDLTARLVHGTPQWSTPQQVWYVDDTGLKTGERVIFFEGRGGAFLDEAVTIEQIEIDPPETEPARGERWSITFDMESKYS